MHGWVSSYKFQIPFENKILIYINKIKRYEVHTYLDIASVLAEQGHMGRGKAVPPYKWQHPLHCSFCALHQARNKAAKLNVLSMKMNFFTLGVLYIQHYSIIHLVVTFKNKTDIMKEKAKKLKPAFFNCVTSYTFPEQRTSRLMPSSRSEWSFWSFIRRLNLVPCLSKPGCPWTSSNSDRFDLQSLWRSRFLGAITIRGFLNSLCIWERKQENVRMQKLLVTTKFAIQLVPPTWRRRTWK